MSWIGIDAHKDTLAVAEVDDQGRQLDCRTFVNNPDGYTELVHWLADRCTQRVGIEGSGSLGRQAALALQRANFAVVEVPPQMTAVSRRHSRSQGKTDPIDALIIARIVLRDEDLPSIRPEGWLDDLRALVCFRRDLMADRNREAGRLHADLEQLRPGYQDRIQKLSQPRQLTKVRRLLAGDDRLRARLARQRVTRLFALCRQIEAVTTEISQAVSGLHDDLVAIPGVADLSAAEILAEVGDVGRFRTKAQFAMSNGTAPVPASSGRTHRYRLNRGGNRQLNRILHFVALTQISRDSAGKAYYLRKQSEGRSRKDALRCLKRKISDRVFQALRRQADKVAA